MNSSSPNFHARSISTAMKCDAISDLFSSGIHSSPSLAESDENKLDSLSTGPVSTKRSKRAKRLYPKQRDAESRSSSSKKLRCDELSNYIAIGSDISFTDVVEDVYPELSTSSATEHQSLGHSQIFCFEESYELSQYILGNDETKSDQEDVYSISSWTTGGEISPSEDTADPSLAASSLVEYHASFFNEHNPIPNDLEDVIQFKNFSRQVSDDDESSQDISLANTAISTLERSHKEEGMPIHLQPNKPPINRDEKLSLSTSKLLNDGSFIFEPVSSASSNESSCSERSSSQQQEQNYIYDDFVGLFDDAHYVTCFSDDEGYQKIADVKSNKCSSDNGYICTATDFKTEVCSSFDKVYTKIATDLKPDSCSSFDKGYANVNAELKPDDCISEDKEHTSIDTSEKTRTRASDKRSAHKTSTSPIASGAIVLSNLDVLLGRGKKTTFHPGNKRFRKLVAKQKPRYSKSKRSIKTAITIQVMEAVRNYGGRFLQYCEESSSYIEVDDRTARRKCSQRLRECK